MKLLFFLNVPNLSSTTSAELLDFLKVPGMQVQDMQVPGMKVPGMDVWRA